MYKNSIKRYKSFFMTAKNLKYHTRQPVYNVISQCQADLTSPLEIHTVLNIDIATFRL